MPASTVEFVADNRFAAYDVTTANASTAGRQSEVVLTRLASGFVGVWNDAGTLVAQRFDDSGARVGVQVVVGTASTQYNPSVDATPAGGFVVAWQGPDADSTGIFARTFGSDGVALGGAVAINAITTGTQSEPDVAVLADGRFAVTWSDIPENNFSADIKARIFGAGGATLGDEFVVSAIRGRFPSIDGFLNGSFVVAFGNAGIAVDGGPGSGIIAQVVSSSGISAGPAVRVASTSQNESYATPDVAVLSSGDYAVTWASGLRGPAINGMVRVGVVRADGTIVAADRSIQGNVATPAITAIDGGGFAVAMSNVNPFYSRTAVLEIQTFDNAGGNIGKINAFPAGFGYPLSPSITGFGSGDLALGWVTTADDFDIALRTYFSTTNGTAGADSLTGTAANDAIRGTDGNDTIDGGDGDDVIDGGAGTDALFGGNGNDVFDGGPGQDSMSGGAGDDIFYVDVGRSPGIPGDQAFGDVGFDTIITSVSYEAVPSAIERLMAAPGTAAINLTGQVGMQLVGNDGANFLTVNGFPDSAASTLNGGRGDDTYAVQSATTLVIEAAGGGKDGVLVSNAYAGFANFTLAAGAEIESLSTATNSTVSAFQLAGNQFAQVIVGDYGNNVLTGGGTGLAGGANDALLGLRGDDSYVVDSVRLVVIENANEGNDIATVTLAGSDFVLNAGTSVEILRTASGTEAINITGSPDSQRIEGNAGNNILSTGSGAADTLVGGLGDDIYRVFGGIDTIFETAGQGLDRVFVSGNSFALNVGASVEYVSVSVQADTGNFYLVGNEVTQVIVGNFGDNTLDGNSTNSGNADTMIGLAGNDIYRVNVASDGVQESAGQGNDTVLASVSYQLRAGVSVETLSAVSQTASDAASQYALLGNEIGQTMVGNDAANTLDGRGGNDVMIGRGGGDVFSFTSALGTDNIDQILDFASGSDRIGLASDVFAGLSGGVTAGSFVLGTTAVDGDDRILYEQASGRLFYDADANGAGAAVQFAQLSAGTALSAGDFLIVTPVFPAL